MTKAETEKMNKIVELLKEERFPIAFNILRHAESVLRVQWGESFKEKEADKK